MAIDSDIAFAQVREDPLIDEEVARTLAARAGRPIRVLMIASGGCTVLGLLALPEVDRLVAVDANPAQLHWVELRRQALAHLSHADHLALLDGSAATYPRLRPHLPPATAAYWDAHLPDIESGLLHCGRFEALFRDLAAALRAAAIEPFADPAAAITSPRWRPVFEQVFERGILARTFGPAAVDYSMDRSFGEHFADVVAVALQRWPAGSNYFLHQMLQERYVDGPGGRPPCLDEATQAAARARGVDRLELRPLRFADAVEQLAAEPPYDLVHTSNISDWMPVAEMRAMLGHVAAHLAPGGAVIGRRLNGDHRLADVFADVLDVDRARCERLRAADRSFFYREVVVGTRLMKLIHVNHGNRGEFQAALAGFDAFTSYPLGSDRFRLDQGPDYYAFFDRLGRVSAYVMFEGDQLIGTGMGILRRVPYVAGGKPRKTWYACDAKVHPDHRGRGLGMGAASRHFLAHYLRCAHGYAITMNPGDGRENGVVRHAQRYKRARIHIAGILAIFSLDADAMTRLAPLVVQHRGPLGYLSLQGKKDLILDSSGARMPLLHVQFGPCAEPGLAEPVAGHTHMLCALQTDELTAALAAEGVTPSATATILAHRMDPCDWRFVLTSDI